MREVKRLPDAFDVAPEYLLSRRRGLVLECFRKPIYLSVIQPVRYGFMRRPQWARSRRSQVTGTTYPNFASADFYCSTLEFSGWQKAQLFNGPLQ